MALPRIAIVGAPNVGKSTLFNRLVGRRRSLVADLPGLTRDLIEARATLGGRRVVLVDTGGLMPEGSTHLAGAIRESVVAAARASDLLLLVVDARSGRTALDEDLAQLFRESGRPVLLVLNKVDNSEGTAAAAEFSPLGFEETVPISAEHGLGLAEIHAAVERILPATEGGEPEGEEVRIAIVGRPNVGKSSLLNALLREERSLVSEIPGTTRDSVDAPLERRERLYRLIDTAGLRRPGRVERGAESLSAGAARRSVKEADVTLVLIDAVEGVVAQDLHVLGLVAGGEGEWIRPAVVLLNKIDLLPSREKVRERVAQVCERLKFARFAPVIPVSALKRLHLDRIVPAVDAVHAEATRSVPTSQLNDWLREATARHHPPLEGGRPVSFVFGAQTGTQPPTFTILTNRRTRVHFSYARYLENSLRERFALRLTPIVLRFRARTRSSESGRGRGRAGPGARGRGGAPGPRGN